MKPKKPKQTSRPEQHPTEPKLNRNRQGRDTDPVRQPETRPAKQNNFTRNQTELNRSLIDEAKNPCAKQELACQATRGEVGHVREAALCGGGGDR